MGWGPTDCKIDCKVELMLLTMSSSVKLPEIKPWIHHTQIKAIPLCLKTNPAPRRPGEQWVCEPLEDLRLLFKKDMLSLQFPYSWRRIDQSTSLILFYWTTQREVQGVEDYTLLKILTLFPAWGFNSQAEGQSSLRQVITYDYNDKSNSHRSSKMLQCVEVKWSESRSGGSNSLQPHRLYSQWNSPGQNTAVGSLSLLQGIFSTQGSNPGLPHCRWILYQLSSSGGFLLKTEFQKPFRAISGHDRVGKR